METLHCDMRRCTECDDQHLVRRSCSVCKGKGVVKKVLRAKKFGETTENPEHAELLRALSKGPMVNPGTWIETRLEVMRKKRWVSLRKGVWKITAGGLGRLRELQKSRKKGKG